MGLTPTSIKVAALGSLVAVGAGLGIASATAATSPSPATSTSTTTSTSASSGTQANNGTTGGTQTAQAAPGDRGPGDRGGHGMGKRGMDTAALATELGIDEATVTAAVQKVREALKPAAPAAGSTTAPTPPTEAERAAREKAFATALAKELGIDEAKVTAALTKVKAAHAAEHRAELTTRLDAAVTAGKLTAADKASVLKAFDAGVLGGPGGPRA